MPRHPTTNHACAACKYQRRGCPPNCVLAPYFPPDNPTQFFNAHKLFGVHNIIKAALSVGPTHREDAMKSLIFTANARARDPVGGCVRIIHHLEAELTQAQAQLEVVLACLSFARAQYGGDVNNAPSSNSVKPSLGR